MPLFFIWGTDKINLDDFHKFKIKKWTYLIKEKKNRKPYCNTCLVVVQLHRQMTSLKEM